MSYSGLHSDYVLFKVLASVSEGVCTNLDHVQILQMRAIMDLPVLVTNILFQVFNIIFKYLSAEF